MALSTFGPVCGSLCDYTLRSRLQRPFVKKLRQVLSGLTLSSGSRQSIVTRTGTVQCRILQQCASVLFPRKQ